jgi:hypothetical protein
MDGDAYSLDGVGASYRKLIKAAFFKLINAREGQKIRPPKPDALPEDWTWQQLFASRRGGSADRLSPRMLAVGRT